MTKPITLPVKERIIKFRAWDVDGEQWLREDQFLIYPNGTVEAWIEKDIVKNTELTQFTGLRDKNGKEIFEGDVVKDSTPFTTETVGEVVYEGAQFCLDDEYGTPMHYGDNYKVIGNIYENPELLRKTK